MAFNAYRLSPLRTEYENIERCIVFGGIADLGIVDKYQLVGLCGNIGPSW